jgi:LEA14-like dessication related protein
MELSGKHAKYAIAATLLLVAASVIYTQVKSAIDYVMKYKYLRVVKISKDLISFNLFFDLSNKSKIKYEIKEIITDIYVNDSFVTKIANFANQPVAPESTSEIAVNVALSPEEIAKQAKLKWQTIVLYPDKTTFTLKTKFKVAYGPLWFYVPYDQTITFKTLLRTFK